MPDKIYHSEKLDLDYKIKYGKSGRVLVFQDDVNYQESEFKKLDGFSDNALKTVHDIKNIFGGVIV